MRKYLCRLLIITIAICGLPRLTIADDATVTIWTSEVVTAGSLDGSSWDLLGKFRTLSEASACSLAWSKAHPKSLRLTRERELTVAQSALQDALKVTKEAEDALKAAKVAKGKIKE